MGESYEVEVTLIIGSGEAHLVVSELANLASIGQFRLCPLAIKMIYDRYLDTPGRTLQAQGWGLRIREIGDKHWITIKGPPQPDQGGVKRLEIEIPWSEEALVWIARVLSEQGINVFPGSQFFDRADPLRAMSIWGLGIVQARETQRETKMVQAVQGKALAELAIDSVVYHFPNQSVSHYEVEIEAKSNEGLAVLDLITESLIALYPVLRRWEHSKLATGGAIEKLLREGILEGKGWLDDSGQLKPAAYEWIDEYLKRTRRYFPAFVGSAE